MSPNRSQTKLLQTNQCSADKKKKKKKDIEINGIY